MTGEEVLDELAQLHAARDVLAMEKQQLLDSVLTPAIRQQMADIEAEFAPRSETLAQSIADHELDAKRCTLERGATITGQHFQAVYMKGRVSWDTKGLDGYAVAHPEMATFRTTGQPSVSIKKK